MRYRHTKDIPDELFLRTVKEITDEHPTGALRWEIEVLLGTPGEPLPAKLVLAKARKLVMRRLLDGCYCGCRGDFELTDTGRALIMMGPKED